jgi:uncharacterized protein
MDIKIIKQIAERAMSQRIAPPTREPGWIYHHGLRTARIALWLREELSSDVDPDVLSVGALFHDLGKDCEPHNETGAALSRELLREHCSAEELEDITAIIRLHNQRKQPNKYPPAVTIVQDADSLDHVGAIDVWMAFYWSGVHRETFRDHQAHFRSQKNQDYRQNLRENLNYEVSRKEFDRRIAFEDDFFQTFRHIYQHGI